MARWGLLAVLLPFIASWLVSPMTAAAHPKLIKSSPEAGSTLETSPTAIDLFFTEDVSLDISTVKMLDRARREMPVAAPVRVDEATSLRAPVTGPLAPGVYTVVWRVLSTVDGHLIAGSFAFRVKSTETTGGGTPEPVEPIEPVVGTEGDGGAGNPFEGTASDPSPTRWVIRAIILSTAVLLLGGSAFIVLVVEPTAASQRENGARLRSISSLRFARLGAITALILMGALILDLLMQVAEIAATDVAGALARGDLAGTVLNTTRYGLSWVLKAIAGLVLFGLMVFAWLRGRRETSSIWELAVAAGSLLMVAQSLGSHAAAVSGGGQLAGVSLPIVNDWLHLVTVSTWAGGLGYMALALFPAFREAGFAPEQRRAFLAGSVPRFSRIALVSVVALGLSGTYNLLIHSNDLGAVLGSRYGQVLALKVALFVALVALGAVNMRRLSPRLRLMAGEEDSKVETAPVRSLRRNVRLELALAAVALLCAGGLTLLPPPSSATSAADSPGVVAEASPTARPTTVAVAPTSIPTPQPVSSEEALLGYTMQLSLRPSFEGDEVTLVVTRTDQTAPPLDDISKVLFKVTPQDVDAGSASYPAERISGDSNSQVWSTVETILTLDGGYVLTAIVQRTTTDDLRAAFRLDLSVDTGLRASPAEIVDVVVVTNPSPPKNGPMGVDVTLKNGVGVPIEGAKVTVNPFMPAHGDIEPPSVAEPVQGKPGTYATSVNLRMGGSWLFIFYVERQGLPTLKTDASFDVIGPTATPKAGATPRPTNTAVPTKAP